MRVVTWNIHSAVGMDGKPSVDRIVAVLESLEPDFVALQEVAASHKAGDQPMLLAEALRLNAVFQANVRRRGFAFGNLILSAGEVTSTLEVSLPGEGEQRGLLLVRSRMEGEVLAFACTHLGLDAESRAKQKATIADEVPGGAPLVLAGDFNEQPEDLGNLGDRLQLAQPHPSFPARHPNASIDLVLASEEWEVERTFTVPTEASDHLPVVADLQLRGN